jgi:hypothetical protein
MPIIKAIYLESDSRYVTSSTWFLRQRHHVWDGTNFEYLNRSDRPSLTWPIKTEWPENALPCRSHRYNFGPTCSNHGVEVKFVELSQNGVVFTHHNLLNGHLATAPYILRGFGCALYQLYLQDRISPAGFRFNIVYEGTAQEDGQGDLHVQRMEDGVTPDESINERQPPGLAHP